MLLWDLIGMGKYLHNLILIYLHFYRAINAFGAADHLVYLTDALISVGFNQEQINKVMGGNVLRVLKHSLPK